MMKIDDRFKCLSAISTPAFSTFVQTGHRQTFPGPENLRQSFTPRLITLIPIRDLKRNLETWSSPFVHLLTYTLCQKRFSGHGPAFGPLAHAASTALVIKSTMWPVYLEHDWATTWPHTLSDRSSSATLHDISHDEYQEDRYERGF